MERSNRKSFLKTLGILGGGSLLLKSNVLASPVIQAESSSPLHTQPLSVSGAKRVLRVAHLTDIHIKNERAAEYGMAAALHAVNSMADKPDFIINGGDAIMNAASLTRDVVKDQWNCFHRIFQNENSLPLYHCIGNHDLYGWLLPSADHAEAKKWAKDEYQLTKSYYAFERAGWKFIVLDSIHGRKSVPGYFGKLDDEQMLWLKQELEGTPATTHVCVVSHIPILAICCLFDNDVTSTGKLKISENNMHYDSDELARLFYSHGNVRACLSGHIHLIDYVNYLGTEYFCNGAVAGEWWKGKHQQFDPAFCVMNLFEDGTVTREVNYYKWST
ncbi:MAG: metallophosphoesterase [Chitinophagales bacterium]